MKKQIILLAIMMAAIMQVANAQVIAFSMDEEAAGKNTPEGWTEVKLPQNLPTFTAENTFYINDAQFGASTSSDNNTAAIQAALNKAASAGGGMVVVPAGEWLFERLTIGSKTVLHLCAGATLKLLPYSAQSHTNGDPYIKGKSGASDIVIEGESNETSIFEGQGGPWWDAKENNEEGLQRGSFIRFSQGQRYLFRNFRIQNAPGTNLTLGQSGNGAHNTVHDVVIYAPDSGAADPSHNTDGIPIWTQYINIYNCTIDTGDDNVVTDTNAQFVHVWNCDFKHGHGASLGSYTSNMHDIIFENLTFQDTGCGFRLKSNVERSGDVYNIIFRNCTMTNVSMPVQITAWYDQVPSTPQSAESSPQTKNATTPEYHNILIQNVTAKGYDEKNSNDKNYNGIMIYGRPESYVYDVTFDNVKISHRNGVRLFFCKGIKFINGCTYLRYKDNKSVKATDDDLSAVMENHYKDEYSWNKLTSGDTGTGTSTGGGGTGGEGGGNEEGGETVYVMAKDDSHIGGKITEVNGITVTFDPSVTDWKSGGSGSSAQEVDGVSLSGYYTQSNGTNNAPINITTTKAGTLTIFFGGNISKAIYMTEGENGLTGKVLSSGASVNSGEAPSATINAWDGIVYSLEANKTYTFSCSGTKWRLAAIRFIPGASGINAITNGAQSADGAVYNLQGVKVAKPTKGVYIQNGKKYVIK